VPGGVIVVHEAEYVARLTYNGRTHDIQPGWSYADIGNARTKCGVKGPFPIESLASGRPLKVTCKKCTGADRPGRPHPAPRAPRRLTPAPYAAPSSRRKNVATHGSPAAAQEAGGTR
jgi:hypothetical protein